MLMSVRGALAATLLAGTALAATPAFAQDADIPADISVSANVALTSDYRFRGVSLSAGDPAIQGGFDISHSSGFYIGTWASSISGGPVYGDQELDVYAGWGGDLGSSGLSLDIGLLLYAYPSGHVGKANYWEPYASISGSLGPASITTGVAYAWDQDSLGNQDNLYIYTDAEVAIPDTPFTLSGHLGYTDGVLAPDLLAGGYDDTGLDWSLGVSATIFGPLSASVSYVGVDGASVDGLTDDTLVVTLSGSF